MKILSPTQIKDLDAHTLKSESITSLELMERAARQVVQAIYSRWGVDTPIVVFAGPGNNGGDALAVSRLLAERGYGVETYLFNTTGKLSAECDANRRRLAELSAVKFTEVTAQFEAPQISADTLVVDGLFGIGLNKPLTGGFATLVKFINATAAPVVSIDIPSGLMCDDNTYNARAHIIRATLTCTFGQPKLSMLLADNAEYVGEMKVLDIGLSKEFIRTIDADYEITEAAAMANLLKPRDPFGHKGTFGNALLVAGKPGMAGAAILSASACLRSGVGKVTVHTPRLVANMLQIALPEAVVSLDKSETNFSTPVKTDFFSALAIGPGLGTERDTAVAFIEQVRHARVPIVIDADGINILCDHKGWIQQIPADTIFTPHPGEYRRLGNHANDPYSSLVDARELAVKQGFFVVLKGHYTAICTPEGKTYFNPTGNSGMATAGSGDCLTGVILSLLSQKYSPLEACRLGVYLHGLAGDIAAARLGEESLMASDIIKALPEAIRQLKTIKTSTQS